MTKNKQTLLVALLLVAGVAASATVMLASAMILPGGLQDAVQFLARPIQLALLPLRFLYMAATGEVPHPEDWQFHVLLILTPLAYTACALGACRALLWVLVHAMPAHEPSTSQAVPSIPRRRFLVQTGVFSLGATGASVAGYGSLWAPQQLHTRTYEVPIPDLPKSLDGLRAVQISDTHYGPFVTLRYLRYAIDQANELNPDLVLLTGDYVQYTPRAIRPGIQIFEHLRPRLGVAAVLGNHDHWEGPAACREAFRELGIPLLDNGRLFLTKDRLAPAAPSDAQALCIAGVGDLWCDAVMPERALADAPPGMPRLLLSHNPDVAELLPEALRVDLMLSGHTHGGQVSLPLFGAPFVPSKYGRRYLGGLCQGPACPVLVSRGVGMAGAPVRMGVPPEISLVVLRRAPVSAATRSTA